jgi:hypothetical protein
MFATPYFGSVDPLKEFRKLTKFEQRKLLEAGGMRKPSVKVEPIKPGDIKQIIAIVENANRGL